MDYDPIRSCLLADPDELQTLGRMVAAGADPHVIDTWLEAGLVAPDSTLTTEPDNHILVHPTLAGIASLLGRPDRTITVERFAGGSQGHVAVMFLSWDRRNRCIITEGVGDNKLLVTATQLKLLPGLLSQALRINPDAPTSARAPITTTAAAVAAVFQPESDPPADDLLDLSFVGDLSHAWRATGAWADQDPDATITAFHSTSQGFWSLTHHDQWPGSTPSTPTPETTVALTPLSPADLLTQLGSVITGAERGAPSPTGVN